MAKAVELAWVGWHTSEISIDEPTVPVGQVRRILTDEDPLLRQVSAPVDVGDPSLPAHVADLAATLADFRARAGFGRAISAPQIGILKRLIVMNLGEGAVALVNPKVVARGAGRQMVWDDCLSVPGKLVLVERSDRISMRYVDVAGETVDWSDLSPGLSELMEHECDHLDGVLMTDRAAPGDSIRPMPEDRLA